MPENYEESSDLRQYWQVLARKRWWLALPAFTIWVLVWSLAWFLPATYRSEAVILVEHPKVPEQYVGSDVAAGLEGRLQTMTQQILSRTRLLAIVDENNLYPGAHGPTPDALVEAMRRDIQIDLVQSPDPRRGELTAFKVAYLARDPMLAQKVTAALTSFFVNENSRARREQSEQTTQFLRNQLEDARKGLADQETKVREFKNQYLGQLPEQVQSNVQILSGLQTQLQQEMDALSRAKQQNVYLESLLNQWHTLESDLQAGRSASAGAPPALDQELERLRAQLAALSPYYTDRHPDVQKLKDQIAETERMKAQMEAKVAAPDKSPTEDGPLRPNSYAELQAMSPQLQVESQLKSNKLDIESRQRAVRDLQQQIQQYQARLNVAPVREQQLAALTRDYEQSRKNYEQLLAKRDQSEMASDLERGQEGEQFRVLDAANLPQKPDSPNRLKVDLIGLVAGLAFGMISLAGREKLDDRIYRKEDYEKAVPVAPVLVEIPPLPTEAEEHSRVRWNLLQLVALGAIVLCTAAGFAGTFLFG